MGNKVNLFNLWRRNYYSVWHSDYKLFGENIIKDHKIRSFLNKINRSNMWGLSSVSITRIDAKTHIEIKVEKPGIVIGKSGQGLDYMKSKLSVLTGDAITVQVIPLRKPETDARSIANRIAYDLSKGKQYKFMIKKYMANAMSRPGIKGISVECSGRLGGVEIARVFKLSYGSVPRKTIRAHIDYALAESHTNSGICGVKVWINKGMVR